MIGKKQKIRYSLCAAALCVALCCTVSGDLFDTRTKVSSSAADLASVHVWTTYSDYNVMRDPSAMIGDRIVPPAELSADANVRIDVTMGRGETESGQLILSPSADVAQYDLTVSPLVSGQNTLQDIEVFMQHYTLAVHPDTVKYATVPSGWFPDMLVPLDSAKKAGENKIAAGQNQGLTVNFTTAANAVPGVYTGEFTLTVDGASQKIPVSVTVRDIDLHATSNVKVAAAAAGDLNESAYEMLMNDYRVLGQYPAQASYSPADMVKAVQKYWDNPKFSNFDIPNNDPYMFKAFVKELAKASTIERNYLTKAVCYLQSIDESNDVALVRNTVQQYNNAKQQIKLELAGYFADDRTRDAVFDAIDDIVVYVTATSYSRSYRISDFHLSEYGGTFCGEFSAVGRTQELMNEYRRESKSPIWIYANFNYPDVGTSIINYGQATRALGWTMAENDIAGYLFWSINLSCRINSESHDLHMYTARDYYKDGLTFLPNLTLDPNYTNYGDGSLIYPAKKYGEPDGWYGSMRLANFRDGIEDNEALWQLEQRYNALADTYGSAVPFDEALAWVYNKGLSSAECSYYADNGKTVLEMRDVVFDLFDLAGGDQKFLLEGIAVRGDTATATFYANADTATVNGNAVSKSNGKFTYTWNLNDSARISVQVGGKTFAADVFDYGKIVKPLEKDVYMSDSAPLVSGRDGDGNAAKVRYVRDEKTFRVTLKNTQDTTNPHNAPVFYLNNALFGVENLFDVYYVSFTMRIRFKRPVTGAIPLAVTLNQNSWLTSELTTLLIDADAADRDGWIDCPVALRLDYLEVQSVQRIGFTFSGFYRDWYLTGADLEISDVCYTVRNK